MTLPRSLARGAAILSALGAAATAVIVAPTATAVPCPDIEVVFARGTAEPAGVGRVGQAFTDRGACRAPLTARASLIQGSIGGQSRA